MLSGKKQLTKLSQFIVESLATEYQAGVPTSELGRRFKISPATVCRALRSVGISPKRTDGFFAKSTIDDSIKKDIITRFKARQSVKFISQEMHLHHYTVTKILRDGKYLSKQHLEDSDLRKCDVKVIAEEYKSGKLSKGALAQKYKVSVNTISRALDICGVETRKAIPDDLLQEITAEYKRGFTTVNDLAKIYDVHPFLLRYHLTNAGLDVSVAGKGASPMEIKANSATGVPAGRIRRTIRENSDELVEILFDIARNAEKDSDRRAAVNDLLDRGYGKPKEMDDTDDVNTSQTDRILRAVPKSAVTNILKPQNDETPTPANGTNGAVKK